MTAAITTAGLTKDYGRGRGLFDLDLEIPAGEVFGYLGPNGAGKTTTIRLLMALSHPTRGAASIFGLDSQKESVAIKRRTGYIAGELPAFGGMRGRDVVAYLGAMRGGVDQPRVRELADHFELDLGRRFREYSRGNKQKLAIVLGFMHRPELLVLDEPTGGLDPLNQRSFYDLVKQTAREGATVFLSSHILSEVEHVCDRVGIIRDGHLVKVAGLADLHEIHFHHVEVEFADEPPLNAIRNAAGVSRVEAEDHRVRCIVHGSFEPLMAILAGAHVTNLISHEPSLEEAFLSYYTGGDPEDPR